MTKLPTMKRWTGLIATLSVVLAVSAALSISAFAQTQSAKQASESIVKIFAPNGTLRDTVVYSIIASEWPTVKAHLNYQLNEKAR